MVRLYNISWADQFEKRLYLNNLVLESARLFQQWLHDTATNVEDLQLEILESEQTQCNVDEHELQQAILEVDEVIQRGRLFLPYNHVNSPEYCKFKLLDVQALVSKRQPSSTLITISATPRRKFLQKFGISTARSSSFFPLHDRPQLINRPDITDRVESQFANKIINDLVNNSKEYIWLKCVRMVCKLEFQALNRPYYHTLLSWRLFNWTCG